MKGEVLKTVTLFLKKTYPNVAFSENALAQLSWRMDGHPSFTNPEKSAVDTTG